MKKFKIISTAITKLLNRDSSKNDNSIIKNISHSKIIENLCNEGRIHSGNLSNYDK